jgi:hypothetical protein
LFFTGILAGWTPQEGHSGDLVKARDGSGVYGYRDTPIQPWSGFHVHDPDRPVPRRIFTAGPAQPLTPPSDALVLFDGKDLSHWQKTAWKLVDGCVEATTGNLITRQDFGDCQVHLEYVGPVGMKGPWYNQGNNGVFLMGLFEVQIFDSWNEKIYADGMAGAIYGQTPPLVNACRKPGEWQTFDILFQAPVFQGDKLLRPAYITVLHNGVLVQNHLEIRGETGHWGLPAYAHKKSQGPLMLSGHHCPVRFRNIWIRPLNRSGK